MKLTKLMMAATVTIAALGATSGSAWAQAKEQFFPLLSYRTGPYAPNGVPWANRWRVPASKNSSCSTPTAAMSP